MGHENVQGLLEESERLLIECRDGLKRDEIVDLTAFETTIRDLCSMLIEMPREEAITYEQQVVALADALEMLSNVLAMKRDEIKGQIEALNRQEVANSAYSNQPRDGE